MNMEKYAKMTDCGRYGVTGTICGITPYGGEYMNDRVGNVGICDRGIIFKLPYAGNL